MANAPTPPEVAEALGQDLTPRVAFDVGGLAIVGANQAASELFRMPPDSWRGLQGPDLLVPEERPNGEAALRLVASRAIEGYRAVRRFRRADGTEFKGTVWARSDPESGRFVLATIEPEDAGVPWDATEGGSVTIAGVLTDHDWIVELVSSDIDKILGLRPVEFRGSSLLGMLQPAEVPTFILAVSRVAADGGGATLRTHLRGAGGRYVETIGMVVTMCQHSPPRLGLALAPPSTRALGAPSTFGREITVRGGEVLGGMDQFRRQPSCQNFSTRQWEILTRLVRGERTEDIAKALYLSPSTVRNHLTAIYKKVGVHSQVELVTKLLRGEQ
jgi:DNA-binding CsgD family transcriptional regulator